MNPASVPGAPPRPIRPRVVRQGDRDKALRPIPSEARLAALDVALAAWARQDWFEAHEVLEPAWMGTADPTERDLYQGLIKLAAAYVHQARGNGQGMAKNLAGAQIRLARAAAEGDGAVAGIAVGPLVEAVAARVPAPGSPADLTIEAPVLSLADRTR